MKLKTPWWDLTTARCLVTSTGSLALWLLTFHASLRRDYLLMTKKKYLKLRVLDHVDCFVSYDSRLDQWCLVTHVPDRRLIRESTPSRVLVQVSVPSKWTCTDEGWSMISSSIRTSGFHKKLVEERFSDQEILWRELPCDELKTNGLLWLPIRCVITGLGMSFNVTKVWWFRPQWLVPWKRGRMERIKKKKEEGLPCGEFG